jgi:hypothetical protein
MRIYTKTYNSNYAHLAKASPPLAVPAGKMKCFEIPFPSEGFLERLIVWQVECEIGPQGPQGIGGGYAFEVELLNSSLPYPPGVYDVDDMPADDLTAYRLQVPPTAALTQTECGVLSLIDDDFGIGFRNVDGGWTLNQRKVYLLIRPLNADVETNWNVTIQCRTDVG